MTTDNRNRAAYGPDEISCKTCRWWWRPMTGYPSDFGGDEQPMAEDYLRECRASTPFIGEPSVNEHARPDGSTFEIENGHHGRWPLTFDHDGCAKHKTTIVVPDHNPDCACPACMNRRAGGAQIGPCGSDA